MLGLKRCAHTDADYSAHDSAIPYLWTQAYSKNPTMPFPVLSYSDLVFDLFVLLPFRTVVLSCFSSDFTNHVLTIPTFRLRHLWTRTYSRWSTI